MRFRMELKAVQYKQIGFEEKLKILILSTAPNPYV